ncbi:hypothetical protein N7453_011004 [Penicillium expansum]|nr:hypothetical protein N7453_011004 [Penicillium expansum]
MAPIDYSKWDNIDTDSDSGPETIPMPRPQSVQAHCASYSPTYSYRGHSVQPNSLLSGTLPERYNQSGDSPMHWRQGSSMVGNYHPLEPPYLQQSRPASAGFARLPYRRPPGRNSRQWGI